MKIEKTQFFSDGLRLSGNFYLGAESEENQRYPLIVACSGFTGICRIHPERFARYLTKAGFICFGFDYRGFADSEGPRNRVLLEEQVRDIRHALSFAANDSRVDQNRIILIGWGMAGGLILDAAREFSGIIGLAAINGFYSGRRLLLAHKTAEQFAQFSREIAEEQRQIASTGQIKSTPPYYIYPWTDDPVTTEYVDRILRKTPQYPQQDFSFEFADSLYRWYPEAYAPHMHIPIFIAHGTHNKLHPPEEARSLHSLYGGAKQMLWLEDAGHTEWMLDGNPKLELLIERLIHWSKQLVV